MPSAKISGKITIEATKIAAGTMKSRRLPCSPWISTCAQQKATMNVQ